jgi:malonyl-CoA/methylmalonyl-CoA synthetase
MRLFISGSAPLLEETFHAFQERAGHTILERYGMTETGMNTSNPLEGARLPGSVGRPLPDVEARVVGPDGDPLPAGETGALEVKGPNVFSGYWRKSEKTAEVFRADGFFVTGDLARIDEEGRVSIVGRSKDLIISGGFNVYPKEVELVIDALEGISESAVIGLPHPDFGEAVAAVVVAAPADAEPDPRALILDLKERIAGYKVPKEVFFLDELPRNSMGKVQKNVLRERYAQAFGLPGQAPG